MTNKRPDPIDIHVGQRIRVDARYCLDVARRLRALSALPEPALPKHIVEKEPVP